MNIIQRIIEIFASSILVFNHVLQGKMNQLCLCKTHHHGGNKSAFNTKREQIQCSVSAQSPDLEPIKTQHVV